MNISKSRDLLERVGWTGIEAAASAVITVLTGTMIGWEAGLKFVGIATIVAAAKVIVAQRAGNTNDGAAIPGGIREKKKVSEIPHN